MSLNSSGGKKGVGAGGGGSVGSGGGMPEEQLLLADRGLKNGVTIVPNSTNRTGEKQAFLAEPVRLTPAWEESSLPNDELNFKGVTMEQARLETNPPKDRFNIVYLILLLHGIGTLLPWNMFITAKSYFVDYKLSVNYTGVESDYAGDFMPYLGFAAQGPGLVFNWLNIFVQIGGKLTTRIVWSIVVEMVAFIITVTLAMTDTSDWPGVFFWLTMLIVVILNMANGIYQNTVYGMAAKLPPKYTGVIIIGANISGTLSAIISIISLAMAPNPRTAAIYYFITALFVLSTCFDTYFALPLNRFYKYHELMSQKDVQKKRVENIPNGSGTGTARIPYWSILRQCGPQCFNVFLVFCVTLSLFPSVHSDIKRSDRNFMIGKKYYVEVMCFLTFNLCSMIGSSFSTIGSWPGPKMLWVPVVMRIAFVPLFLMCNYHPITTVRTMPVIIDNDWLYWIIGITMGLTNGYFSSVAMMYCSRSVTGEHSMVASMFGAACIITGICGGLAVSLIFPIIVSLI